MVFHRVEGNRRASRNGPVSDLHDPKRLKVSIYSHPLHGCRVQSTYLKARGTTSLPITTDCTKERGCPTARSTASPPHSTYGAPCVVRFDTS